MPRGVGRPLATNVAQELSPGLPPHAYESPEFPPDAELTRRSLFFQFGSFVAVLCGMMTILVTMYGKPVKTPQDLAATPLLLRPFVVQSPIDTVRKFGTFGFAAILFMMTEAALRQMEVNRLPRSAASVVEGRAVQRRSGKYTHWLCIVYARVAADGPSAPLRLLAHSRPPHLSRRAAEAHLNRWLPRPDATVALDPRYPRCAFPIPWRNPGLAILNIFAALFGALAALGWLLRAAS